MNADNTVVINTAQSVAAGDLTDWNYIQFTSEKDATADSYAYITFENSTKNQTFEVTDLHIGYIDATGAFVDFGDLQRYTVTTGEAGGIVPYVDEGDGAEFKLTRTGANKLQVTLDGVVLDTYTMDGVTAANKVTSFGIYHYGNKGENVEIPFVLKTPTDAPDVQLNIPELTGGTVTPAYDKYLVGDTVTLMITPDAGYSQKLYINGEPMLVNANGAYSFEATEKVYNITGSFEPSLSVSTNERWYATNQAHGILNAYYPNNNDAWKMSVNGEYNSLAIMVKNFLPQADTMEGDALGGFSAVIGVKMDNGNIYSFRIINKKIDGAPQYQYSRFGGDGNGGRSG